ncbi:MAG: copper amine oxidase [Armatimonadetes bacterium]|nr:copper amine oxidase [Armatimonadota bacterium]
MVNLWKKYAVFKSFFLVLFLGTTLACFSRPPANAGENPGISVLVDGLPVNFDAPPIIQNDRVLVPFRAVAEALNVPVSWDARTKTVTAAGKEVSLRLQIAGQTAYVNEKPVRLDAPPVIVNNRTLIPLRFFSEALGCRVAWDGERKEVQIWSGPAELTVIGFYALGDSETSSWQDLFGKAYPETGKGNTDLVDELALGWYSLDGQGNLLTRSTTGWQRPAGWEDVLQAARDFGLKTEMVVHVTDKDGFLANLLTDAKACRQAVDAIAREAEFYQGVNLDFEGLGYQEKGEQLTETRRNFVNFVSLLAKKLKEKEPSPGLTLTLHAPNSHYPGYDYRELGQIAGRLIVMAYDYGPKPEPVNLARQAVEMALAAGVPPEKLILGISAPAETPESILTKVGIAKRYDIAGIALWRLGLVSDKMWTALRTTVQMRK